MFVGKFVDWICWCYRFIVFVEIVDGIIVDGSDLDWMW